MLLMRWWCWCADAADAVMLLMGKNCLCADAADELLLLLRWWCWCTDAANTLMLLMLLMHCRCSCADELMLLMHYCCWCADVLMLLMLLIMMECHFIFHVKSQPVKREKILIGRNAQNCWSAWGGYSEILKCVRRLCEKVVMGWLLELLRS